MTKFKKFIYKKVGKVAVKKAAIIIARKEARILVSAAATYAGHRVLQKVVQKISQSREKMA